MRDDLVIAVSRVEGRLKDLDPFARDHGTPQAADQFFALARKHRSADHFDPSDVAADELHRNDLVWHSVRR